MKPHKITLLGILACFLFGADAIANLDVDVIEQSVVRVVTQVSGRNVGHGSGFVVNDGIVVTNQHVVDGGQQFRVILSGNNTGLEAQLLHVDERHDLAILRVPGLSAKVVRLSSNEVKKTDTVWAVGFPGLADRMGTALSASLTNGTVSRVFSGSWDRSSSNFKIIQHSAEINPGNSGGPLFDDCGRVVGVNTQGSGSRITRDDSGLVIDIMAGTGVFFASHIEVAMNFLRGKGIDFTADARPCISTSEDAKGTADKAKDTADKAKEAAEQALDELEGTQSGLLSLSERIKIWGVVLAMLGILSILLALRKPRERIVRTVEQYTRKAADAVGIKIRSSIPGLVLTGFNVDGKPIKVVILGKYIDKGYGATIGRHPAITAATIEDQFVSRRQCRFSYADQTHYIEDLNSSNGTWVNKVRLKPFIKTPVNPGDTITAGNLEFNLSRHQ